METSNKTWEKVKTPGVSIIGWVNFIYCKSLVRIRSSAHQIVQRAEGTKLEGERGDVPGWVLVVLMTTGLVTAIWTIAAPRLSAILRNSLDSMNGIR